MEEQNYSFYGLSSLEVQSLRKKYGLNEVVKIRKVNPLQKFFGVFKEPMFLLLLGAAALYFILGEPRDALIMMIFVVFVAAITFVQEWKTERTVDALKDLTSPKVKVLRDGNVIVIKSTELVPGDIIFLSEGERIPADCKVLEVSNFSVDESILTGETEAVFKITVKDSECGTNIEENGHWKNYCIYAGTLATFGKCTAEVIKIGLETEYGKIGKAISEIKEKPSPLQNKINKLVKNLAYTGIVLCTLVIIFSYFYTKNIMQSILSGITLAMAIIPEEFPVVLTVFLSLGALRLAKKNTLMRKISAVETLGSATVLCVDKTGTITQNQMKVRCIYDGGEIKDSNIFRNIELSKLMILSCEKQPYDPMEKAIVDIASHNSSVDEMYSKEIALKIPFDSVTKRMANIYKDENSDDYYYTACKGSPETILELCSMSDEDRKTILQKVDIMASRGLRVMAFADTSTVNLEESLESYNLQFRGLVGLQDPPKEGVREAVQACNTAGVRVIMITGDYSKTAAAIGAEIGLKLSNCSLTGDEIGTMNDEKLSEAVKHCDIFSRVIPEHKMRIVKALQKNGEVVAMTGDGVNDATALKNADIGIAMGKRGTEVAREASHMILMDDNFTTIVSSIEDGRRVFDNIRKAIVYIMIIHIPIAALSLCAPIFNLPQMLLPVHIVLLELIIDPTCSIVFEGEEAEPYIMEQPPRNADEPLMTREMLLKVMLQGLSMFLVSFLPFHYMVDLGMNIELARSFALMALIISNVVLVLVNRSNTQYVIDIFREKSKSARIYINIIAILMVFTVIYIPFFQNIFSTTALSPYMLALSCLLGVISTGWWDIVKFVKSYKKVKKVRA